jgi:hypothetical protein
VRIFVAGATGRRSAYSGLAHVKLVMSDYAFFEYRAKDHQNFA